MFNPPGIPCGISVSGALRGQERPDDEQTTEAVPCPEQVVRKLRDADTGLNAGPDRAAVLRALEVSEQTDDRWPNPSGGIKSGEARRLMALEDENERLKQLVAHGRPAATTSVRYVESRSGDTIRLIPVLVKADDAQTSPATAARRAPQ